MSSTVRYVKGIPVGVPFRAVLDPVDPGGGEVTSNDLETFILLPYRTLQRGANIISLVPNTAKSKAYIDRLNVEKIKSLPDTVPEFTVLVKQEIPEPLVDTDVIIKRTCSTKNKEESERENIHADETPDNDGCSDDNHYEQVSGMNDKESNKSFSTCSVECFSETSSAAGENRSKATTDTNLTVVKLESAEDQDTVSQEKRRSDEIELEPVKSEKIRHKSADLAFSSCVAKVKTKEKKEDEDENSSNRRKSARIRSKGFRVDYTAMDEAVDNCVDSETENAKEDGKDFFDSGELLNFYQQAEEEDEGGGRSGEEYGLSEEESEGSQDGQKKTSRQLEEKDPEFEPEEIDVLSDEEFASTGKRSKDNLNNVTDDEVVHMMKNKPAPRKRRNGTAAEKGYRIKRSKRTKKKLRSVKGSKPARITVLLEDHPDKFKKELVESMAMKDRGLTFEEKAKEMFTCLICKTFRTVNKLPMEKHLEQHLNQDFSCKLCTYTGSMCSDLFHHMRNCHNQGVLCEDCGEKFSSIKARNYIKHMTTVHKKPMFTCFDCKHVELGTVRFLSQQELDKHRLEMHADLVFKCDRCGVQKYKKNMRQHLNACNGVVGYPCEICGRTFDRKHKIATHIRRLHDRLLTHGCDKCDQIFPSRTSLTRHKKIHDGDHQYRCDQCDFTCVQSNQLISHRRTHSGEKPYKCDLCKYAAAWNVLLKEHKKIHFLNNTVNCDDCEIVFKDQKALTKHMKKDHAEQK